MRQLLTQQELNGIRDLPDAKEASNTHFDRLKQLVQRARTASTGQGSAAPGCPGGIIRTSDGGIAQGPRGPACATRRAPMFWVSTP